MVRNKNETAGKLHHGRFASHSGLLSATRHNSFEDSAHRTGQNHRRDSSLLRFAAHFEGPLTGLADHDIRRSLVHRDATAASARFPLAGGALCGGFEME